jgi:Spy/CpxP family protein refolding chaperone
MKNTLTVIAFGMMTAASASALAQNEEWGYGPANQQGYYPGLQRNQGYGPGPGMKWGRGDSAQRIQRRLDRMAQHLELNEGQKTQIKAILEEQHAKRSSMRDETHNRIAAVLNEQQRIKLDEMRAQRRKGGGEGGRGRRSGGHGYGAGKGLASGG